MLNRNNKKAKRLLQIDVDSEGEEDQFQSQQRQVKEEQLEEQQQQQEQEEQEQLNSDDSDLNSQSQQHQFGEELDSDDNSDYQDHAQSQVNSSSQSHSLSHHENYSSQSSSTFHNQQTHSPSLQSHAFPSTQQYSLKQKSIFNQQQYLIVENQYNNNNSLSLLNPPRTTNNKDGSILLTEEENDKEVDKIIREVLFKRKRKQKQMQLIENIINAERNHDFVDKLNSNKQPTTGLQFIDPTFRKQKKQQTRLKSYESMMKKCKQLEIKINRITKKQLERQKTQSNKQSLKQKKQKLMSKKQLSLQKLKKRLQKALSLNLSLTKRVKLQKSQLASICLMKSHSNQTQQPTINQESSIKGIQSVQLMNKKGQKCHVEDNFRSKNSYEQLSSIEISREKERGAKKSQESKQKKTIATNKRFNQLEKNKQSSPVQQQISSFSPSTATYKSPILQFNSYLIDEQSQFKSPPTNKENIYIEDDMNSLPNLKYLPTLSYTNGQSSQENQRLFEQLKVLMGEYLMLDMKEKSLQERVERNCVKIKEYEDEHYYKIVAE